MLEKYVGCLKYLREPENLSYYLKIVNKNKIKKKKMGVGHN